MFIVTTNQIENFETQVGRGKVDGNTEISIFGHNPSQALGVVFIDVTEHGNLTYLTTAETLDIVSTSANDTNGGTGLHTIFLFGLDANHDSVFEVVVMNGLTPVSTVNSYLRLNTMQALFVGISEFNLGNITATAPIAAAIQCQMNATEGLSQNSTFTVPRGFTFEARLVRINSSKVAGGPQPVLEIKLYGRVPLAAWIQVLSKKFDTAIATDLELAFSTPTSFFTETKDLKFVAQTDQNDTEVRTTLEGILYST